MKIQTYWASRFELPARPAHQLAGVTKSGSLFLATSPPCPKAGALTRLRYAPTTLDNIEN
jgi:hypothetical protein